MASNPRIVLLPDGPHVEIDGGSLFLGRDCILALRIPALTNKVVSNRHLRVWMDGDRWLLEDLGSTNGTWLKGERIAQKTALLAGDEFSMGRHGPRFRWEPPNTNEAAGATMAEEVPSMVDTVNDDTDGSDERPFRVGRTPEVRLKHRRTGQVFTGQGYTVVCGRDPGAAAILVRTDEEKHVSGRHVELQFRSNGSCVVRDLESRNGTWLNEKPLKGEAPLKVGDRIILGSPMTTLIVEVLDC